MSSDNPETNARFPIVHPAGEIFQRIVSSEGDKLYWKTEGLRVSYFMFSQNFEALRSVIQSVENPANRPKFVGVDKREQLRAVQMENMRLLHNFLASAITLIHHTRVLVKKIYSEHLFRNEYQGKMDEIFGNSGPAGIISGMRNWMLHRDIVPVKIVIGLFTNQTQSVMLDIEELRSYEKWDARAKAFLAGCDSDLRLLAVAQEYHDQVEHLYTWLGERMSQVHAAAFSELAELKRQYQQAHLRGWA